jgi:serine protease
VGSSTSTDSRSSFSNYGSAVEIFAPGSSITSAWHTGTSATNTISGTSMASPHVAGAAALLLQNNPTATAQQIYDLISTNATKGVINHTITSTTKNLLYTLSTKVVDPIDTNPNPITLSATWTKVSSRVVVKLTFTGITSSRVDIYRNNTKLTKTNTGTYEDRTNFKGTGSITYRVCAAGTTNCSSSITVNYN